MGCAFLCRVEEQGRFGSCCTGISCGCFRDLIVVDFGVASLRGAHGLADVVAGPLAVVASVSVSPVAAVPTHEERGGLAGLPAWGRLGVEITEANTGGSC